MYGTCRNEPDGTPQGAGVISAIRWKRGRAPAVPQTPFVCDGDKPNSVAQSLARMIIYLNSLA
ncbi:hypothetical protein BH18VER1_BH18VER1_03390 [soil metagenome]